MFEYIEIELIFFKIVDFVIFFLMLNVILLEVGIFINLIINRNKNWILIIRKKMNFIFFNRFEIVGFLISFDVSKVVIILVIIKDIIYWIFRKEVIIMVLIKLMSIKIKS